MTATKYPQIHVDFSNIDANAFSLIGEVRKALRKGGVNPEEIKQFANEAMSGDYNHVLVTCMNWVTVDYGENEEESEDEIETCDICGEELLANGECDNPYCDYEDDEDEDDPEDE